MKVVVSCGVLVEIVHGGSALEGRAEVMKQRETEATRKREEGGERGGRRKKRNRDHWNKKK